MEGEGNVESFNDDTDGIGLEDNKLVIRQELNEAFEPQVSCVYKDVPEEELHSKNQRIGTENRLEDDKSETVYSCLLCDYKCSRAVLLHRHKKTHFFDSNSYIHYFLSHASYLQRVHNTGPFACNECPFRCSQPSYLRQHMKSHSGDRPFACDYCPYRCSQRGNLKQHLRIHTGEKPYACGQCDYKCKQRSHLQQHERIHSGIQPYHCDQCEYKFTQLCHLRQHLKAAHKPDQTLS